MAPNRSAMISNEIAKFDRANRGELNPRLTSGFDASRQLTSEKISLTFKSVPLELFSCEEGRAAIFEKAHQMTLEVVGQLYGCKEEDLTKSWITVDPVHPELLVEAPVVR